MSSVAAVQELPGAPVLSSGLRGLLLPPGGLLARVRWYVLLAALALCVASSVAGTVTSAAAGLRWPLTLVAAVVLAAVWVYGYRTHTFNLVTDIVVAAAIIALGASQPDPRYVQFAMTMSIWLRAFHSSLRQTLVGTVIVVAAFVVATQLVAAPLPLIGTITISRVVVAFIFAFGTAVAASVLAAYDRTMARERRLRSASHSLAEARDRQSIDAAALAGARDLVADVAGATVSFVEGDAATPAGAYLVPLVAHGRAEGTLAVSAAATLDDELNDDLQTLGDLIALAIESQTLLDARRAAAGQPTAASVAADVPFDRARAAVAAAQAGPVLSQSLLQPPSDLPARVRWTFLAICFAMTVWVAIVTVASAVQTGFQPLQIVAIAAPLWLGGWWVYGYRRGGFPLIGDVVGGVLLTLLLLSTDTFPAVQPALFASMLFRANYGTGGRVALAAVIHVAALIAAVVLSPSLFSILGSATVVLVALAIGVIAAAIYFIATALARYERALARERALRVSSSLLVAATDRSHVYSATLTGAGSLLSGAPGATVLVAVASSPGQEDDLAVVAAAGEHGAGAAGRHIHVDALAGPLRDTLHQGESVDQPRADAATWQALDLEGSAGSLYAVPLHARGTLEGAIVVGSDTPIDSELKDDLQTLGALASLAVEDAVLAEPTA